MKAAVYSFCLGPGTGEWLEGGATFGSCLIEHLIGWGLSTIGIGIIPSIGSIIDAYNAVPEEQQRVNFLFTTFDL